MALTCKQSELRSLPPLPFVDHYADQRQAKDLLMAAIKAREKVRHGLGVLRRPRCVSTRFVGLAGRGWGRRRLL